MRPQPTLGPDEKEVLRNKVYVTKQYIAPSNKRIKSLIKYFSVTAIKKVVQSKTTAFWPHSHFSVS
jgi:hypothetical protein